MTTKQFEIDLGNATVIGTVDIIGTDQDCTSEAWGRQVTESWTEYEIDSVDIEVIQTESDEVFPTESNRDLFSAMEQTVRDRLDVADMMI